MADDAARQNLEGAMLRDVITWDTASRQGGRTFNADAVGASRDMVFALADGIGDTMWAAEAARVASDVAVRTPALAGPVEAVLAAQRALRALNTGADCVLVVAMPSATGYDVAWVGDVRAYGWDGTQLVQLTSDQTMAEYFRTHNAIPSPRMEHVVTNSLRTTRADQIGVAHAHNCTKILLTSDGLHKTLSPETMGAILAEPESTALTQVSTLVDTAVLLGARDNATACLVTLPASTALRVEPELRVDPETVAMPTQPDCRAA
ncbi:PP2C family protein-serine/threonine phosphatase [Actinocrispum wychmicini]|uniref:PP2C family protein-serine/threonine phosphatase n=1 Tax=Actinocrispum wychmicini TaxID=1213861 RepID=UPI001FB7279D|nr:serine/threonine protein phosphatase [Actinocrispum wychmicini]